MPYDLRYQAWAPWRRRSGRIEWGSPSLVTDQLADDPIVAVVAPRPDFNGAVQEFLIGLLTVALQPDDESEWVEFWEVPPSPDHIREALDRLPPAFDLDGDGPRVFQDLTASDLAETEISGIEQLLIDAPGGQTERLNKDLFVKRGRVERLGMPAAAMALLTLQTYAPSGGQGHRTSLRGGGPLTTLVDPRVAQDGAYHADDQPLWYKLWANVETRRQWAERAPGTVEADISGAFPWLLPTRVSSPPARHSVTPGDAHPLQAYFGLPRRIRLEFDGGGRCDLTGMTDERTVTGFRMRNYGVQYDKWRHPLSPYYRPTSNAEWLPVHPQPGGIGWRDWVGIALVAPQGATREPAAAVAHFYDRAQRVGLREVRVHAFGYDLDNMKARGWVESVQPAFTERDAAERRQLVSFAAALTDGAGIAASALLRAVKEAVFTRPADAPGDLSVLKSELWASTEAAFFTAIRSLATGAAPEHESDDDARRAFVHVITEVATAIFDRWCATVSTNPESIRRVVAARYQLVQTLTGYSPLGERMFEAFGLPAPGGGRAVRRQTRNRRTVEVNT